MFTWGCLRVEGNILLRASADGQKVLLITAGPSYPVSPQNEVGRKKTIKQNNQLMRYCKNDYTRFQGYF